MESRTSDKMKNRLFITIILALAALSVSAQDIFDELSRDQQGQGKIVINQSKEVEKLVKNTPPPAATKPATTPAATPQKSVTLRPGESGAPTPDEVKTHKPPTTSTRQSEMVTPGDEADAPVNTNKKLMRRSYKTTGYRIQVYSGGNKREDRQRCEQIAARIKASFPNLPIYVHFYSPSWKCRAGNFSNYGEATQTLQQIRNMGYKQACLVKGTISVQY